MKWNMQNHNEFTGIDGDYSATMQKGSIGWIWKLYKNDRQIDMCYAHPPTDNELSCKVQIERIVAKFKTPQNINQ